ncbi:AI-2E family transporter [Algoriphagus sp. D3-2-R+10]|uniref:AI-2E family transporter n=1 Tax=Algoriphagus aurantiacus TaxID=3103948 RepID=UPI002B3FB4A1|nr:AI-2E family transporter [Algoriphagus sp. D3-2-R+10]MEB2777826.1 AI-2E family transporter [Algoriphagus sp. D3-2-R+10]
MNENPNLDNSSQKSFSKKVWLTAGIFAFTVLIILFFIKTINPLLLILAGSLIAVFFTGFSSLIERKTGWNRGLCKSISIIGTLLIAISFFWLMGAKVQAQFSELSETIPETIVNAKEKLKETTIGEKVLEKVTSEESVKRAEAFGGQFFQSTFGVFGDLYVVLFIGIFFTVNPTVYTQGLITLVPEKGQSKAEEVSKKLGEQLRDWLKGKLFSMFIVFVLTGTGLAILGLDLWLVLALLAGLLSFVPNFGPLIALIPALLIGLMDGPQTALIVLGIYVLVQFLESNFITPIVQQKLIKMPPAMILIAQLLMGALTGGWGLILATPITVIVIVLVQELYLDRRSDG